MKKYKVEVTEEQLKLISAACELESRLRSGQLHEINLQMILDDIADEVGVQFKKDVADRIVESLKALVGLEPGASLGIAESTERAKKLYEIYYLIKHHFAEGISVYKYDLRKLTDEPEIVIKDLS